MWYSLFLIRISFNMKEKRLSFCRKKKSLAQDEPLKFGSSLIHQRIVTFLKLKAHQETVFQAWCSAWRSRNIQQESAAKVAVSCTPSWEFSQSPGCVEHRGVSRDRTPLCFIPSWLWVCVMYRIHIPVSGSISSVYPALSLSPTSMLVHAISTLCFALFVCILFGFCIHILCPLA